MPAHVSFLLPLPTIFPMQRKLLQANKRQAVLDAKRGLGTVGHSPHLVVVIPLTNHVESEQIHSLFCQACGLESDTDTPPPPTGPRPPTLISHTLKHRFTFVYPSTLQLYSLLDVAKVTSLPFILPAVSWER